MSHQLIVCPSCLRTLKQTAAGSFYCELCGPLWVPEPGEETCPQCGAIRDGVFLCAWCERSAAMELRNQAFQDEFTLHRASRPACVVSPEVLDHWTALKEQLR